MQHAGKISGPILAHRVPTPAAWAEHARAFGSATGNFTELTDKRAERIDAQINAGRWVVRCGYCENAPSAEPDWALAICYECGWTYAPRFPPLPVRWQIEWLLMERPLRHRHWLPDQSIRDLRDENDAAGLDSDPPPYEPPQAGPPVEPPTTMPGSPSPSGEWPPAELPVPPEPIKPVPEVTP